ncbi:MAG: prepilin-type N-terminal cleavage/methylation domain-containing protein [Methylophaga sp.]|nr:prepilin-type N-terminal cleavage/methylation domain-containing protein [Methylophaga sp.]
MKNQQGFTLIELVMVIVILGILAATALPKFANLQGNARMSSLNGALGAIKSASSISHAAWLVAAPADHIITIEGVPYTMESNGYPGRGDIDTLANLSNTDYGITNSGSHTVTIDLGSCSFTYVNNPTSAAPTISIIKGDASGAC